MRRSTWIQCAIKQDSKILNALQLILDCVDYTSGNCRPNEPIGAVLPKEIIEKAKNAIKEIDPLS